nr:immunoglobulin light chain junction region [Macaca mulatta]
DYYCQSADDSYHPLF